MALGRRCRSWVTILWMPLLASYSTAEHGSSIRCWNRRPVEFSLVFMTDGIRRGVYGMGVSMLGRSRPEVEGTYVAPNPYILSTAPHPP
ncbi:hypothetical protein CONLIGDRAFT_209158 [Coniochaeta ligniaria NRRL 30616]|uniref:Secreted protein n=1 Tax=Coniochaeta ligniaria NRRL 30616 TaxID=1408157 RepID=A0A1J7J401_9PEZI|nr:hypothetical protein CONLIGDRAFT_209158 [Coniochaeta ligniaria NRRL 30616]